MPWWHRDTSAAQTGVPIRILLELQATELFTHSVVSRLFNAKMLRYSAAFPVEILLHLNQTEIKCLLLYRYFCSKMYYFVIVLDVQNIVMESTSI